MSGPHSTGSSVRLIIHGLLERHEMSFSSWHCEIGYRLRLTVLWSGRSELS